MPPEGQSKNSAPSATMRLTRIKRRSSVYPAWRSVECRNSLWRFWPTRLAIKSWRGTSKLHVHRIVTWDELIEFAQQFSRVRYGEKMVKVKAGTGSKS